MSNINTDRNNAEPGQQAVEPVVSTVRPVHYLDSPVDTVRPVHYLDSPEELVLDLTAEEIEFINGTNANTTAPGSNINNSIPIDDDTFAFFVEAGLDDPEELAMLGIDVEEIRNQRMIAERLEKQHKADHEAALELQHKGKRPITVIDDDDECIDLTDDNVASSSSAAAAAASSTIPHYDPYHDHHMIEHYDDDSESTNSSGWEEPDFRLFGDEGFGFHHYGAHMESIARFERSQRSLPQIAGYNAPILSAEETEKELRELLEHVMYDEPPGPDARAGTPDGLNITLLEHQKIGLQWMIKMEASKNKGGILADDMGLGKTIQAMAIMVHNTCENATEIDHSSIGRRQTVTEKINIKATLIVCPVSLIDQWRREIQGKTTPQLNVLVYHGAARTQSPYDLAKYDVIISSYAVTASNFQETSKGPFAKVNFHRVVLDEAHTIKNKNTRAALGCCAVDATYRWCMTATPIQNKIEELYSLIKFLRIRPFCEWDEFRDCIAKPMKAGNHKKAIKVAQVLMKAISLRRSKKAMIDGKPILDLPARNVNMTHIDFTPDERNHYDFVNQTAQARFNKYMAAGTVMKNYSSVLVLLLRLRQACLHPSLTLQEGDGTTQPLPTNQLQLATSMKPDVVKRLLDDSAGLAEIECPICMDIAQDAQIIVGCGHILCKECFDGYWNANDGNTKRCPQCRGELDNMKLVTVETFLKKYAPDLYEESQLAMTEKEKVDIKRVQDFVSSSKIDKMMEILDQTDIETHGQDKTIVFSQFTGMLDLIEKPLKDKGFAYLRYDGSMDVKHRAAAVNKFFDDPEVKVLLVSTKCGSLGLNLTIANRVIILDVWWNPALENQAIDRVHRIGQTKDVHVHRLFINDTVEDRILELQNKKQAVADGVLGEGSGEPIQRLGLAEMIYLFRGGEAPGTMPTQQAGPSNSSAAGPSRRL
ncbi:SNF2 family N-terminal domain-containing protein [Mucor mucedo]|uniref:SNF2 family N-terminal domain-containing protein n=1 Tax=Mucor mucedo TaxID=29922 RepID=UPI00221FFD10|nr:SNF2 family N-terminal domain-containing protein [Mucor mucedo]KAI7875063.1 SNF2 family N-terminal domain-containing protein [Mucor mucedo]